MKEKSQFHVHTSGGLLSRQFIEKLRAQDCKEQYAKPATFSIQGEASPRPAELDARVHEAWKNLLGRWHGISLSVKKYDISRARQKWILPFLEELGFKPRYLKKDTMLLKDDGGKQEGFDLSHRGGDWTNAPIIHTVPPSQDLDERISQGRGSKSPHDTLQIYLNHSKDEKWGIVTNGILFRVLRQYHHVYTKGYVEFDLEGIFEERLFSDFLALYRLAHPSRFVRDEKGLCPLEHFYKVSLAAGEKIGDKLRGNVKKAIEVLGNGFLTRELALELSQDTEKAREYYQEVLHVIYRVMFLMFAEQRGMLPSRDSLYASAYSMTRMRERSEKAKRKDRHKDLWQALLTSFKLIKEGVEDPESKMKIFGYNGSLFDDDKISTLKDHHCENTHILEAVSCLTTFEQDKTRQRISYVDLGVEEIGSIYESLLDFTPRVAEEDTVVEGKTYTKGKFFLDPRGAARKSTGSYYTNPKLVNELIKSALKPVMEDRLKVVEDKVQALLSLKVCDPAMGSGAFLIAATNFLGKELAKIRTGTEYPSEKEERRARRDVLQHCIYGVDLNPMAVELAKVSLWIDACVADMPLNFLDHHLKCGNSLIGATPELLKKGIPTEAYSLKGTKGRTKELVKQIRKMNKEQLKEKVTRIDADFWEKKEKDVEISEEFDHLADLPEFSSLDVEKKKLEYQELTEKRAYQRKKFAANAWTAAFFWPVDEIEDVTEALTQADFDSLNTLLGDKEKQQKVEELAEKHRFFHWHLEFPDVFIGEKKGFDCFLGNPPFLGGLKISPTYGDQFRNCLLALYSPVKGNADLCALFFRRVFSLLKDGALFGMVATNTIGQGDTRETGLARIVNTGGVLTFARRFVKWTGAANVEVNLLSLKKGNWKGNCILDDTPVDFISSRLDTESEEVPQLLNQNSGKSFQGDTLRGKGFILGVDEALTLLNKRAQNSQCIFPYLTGEDINNSITNEASRFAICFHDWPLEKAEEFPELLQILEERVKPERQKAKQELAREKWWLFWRYRGEFRSAISSLQRVLVRSRVSELHMLTFVSKNSIFSDATVVFTFEDDVFFALLQSNIHEEWTRRNSSTMRTDVRYTPLNCFETFPFPPLLEKYKIQLKEVAKAYQKCRRQIMNYRQIGLTPLYNLLNDKNCSDDAVVEFRKLQQDMDKIVLTCYDWNDIDLNHGFHKDERGRKRFTISFQAKKEIFSRLLNLNLEMGTENDCA